MKLTKIINPLYKQRRFGDNLIDSLSGSFFLQCMGLKQVQDLHCEVTSQHFISPCLLKHFNPVFTSEECPSKWSENFICPLFKSEDPNQPEYYRGMAINNSKKIVKHSNVPPT